MTKHPIEQKQVKDETVLLFVYYFQNFAYIIEEAYCYGA